MKMLQTVVFIAAIILVLANHDCQRLNTDRCKSSEKHACKADRDCDWSHHNFCYLKCSLPTKCGDELETLKPVLYLKFDDNFDDCSENNFIVEHTPWGLHFFEPGHRGKALRFDQAEVAIREAGTIGTPKKLRVKNEMTFAVWLYGHSDYRSYTLAGCLCILGGGYQLYDAGETDGQMDRFGVYIPDPRISINRAELPASNEWWHLAVRVTTQTLTFFVNGVATQTFGINFQSDIGYIDDDLCPWRIGKTDGNPNAYYYGAMDDFMFFDRALNEGEINTIVTYQSQGKELAAVSHIEQPMAKVKIAEADAQLPQMQQ